MSAVTAVAAALPRRVRRVHRGYAVLAVLAAWVLLWTPLQGRDTLALDRSQLTPLHERLNALSGAIDASRNSNPFFLYVVNEIRLVINLLVTFVQDLISQPSFGRPVPVIGWVGVLAIAVTVTYAVAGGRAAVLTTVGFLSFGALGLWQESMDTLALTLSAVVLSLLVGMPLGVWAGLSSRFARLVTPVLDFMQTMPTFVYLAPLTLFFLIGPASATIATMIYAVPPAIRITAYGVRSVSATTVEASTSLGSTRWQTLRKVQLPMARRTIVLGVNQTMMAALSMVTIAALIDAPGLGRSVLKALETLDVGTAFVAGLAIVVMAIVLDRTTTAASRRVELAYRSGAARQPRRRQVTLGVLGVATVVLTYLSHTYLWAAQFPTGLDLGASLRTAVDLASGWVQTNLYAWTNAVTNAISVGLLNPFQALLTHSPWWLVALVAVALAALLGGRGAAVVTAVCLVLLVASGLWQDAMVTLAATLVATVLVMALGVTVGVWSGRSDRVDRVVRPFLDAGQTMPSFVYLVPFLGLFGATRFTAIVAAVMYAAPASIKLVSDGIRGVPATTVEAATAAGSGRWQLITKVQLPMARAALALAANQGLIYVLAMVVVGGLVGAGGLGYDVVAGFAQLQLQGKGLAAGVAIVLLGIMLDRITQAAARRSGRLHPAGEPGR
ncbi:MAG: ABC transporter permease [Actinomycetota bacterium]